MVDLFGFDDEEHIGRSAHISTCGRYRYSLHRRWCGGDGRTVCFVMCNPSTADGLVDDPTIRRCISFARAWGYSVLCVRNLFCLRATDPAELMTAADPIGPDGDVELVEAKTADLLVAAWGAIALPHRRDQVALEMFAGKPLYVLALTKHGKPRHPLYVKGDAQPILWR